MPIIPSEKEEQFVREEVDVCANSKGLWLDAILTSAHHTSPLRSCQKSLGC